MNDKIKAAFNSIRADEGIKSSTQAFIAQKTRNYTARKAPKYQKIIPAAAAVCLVFALFIGLKLYFTPTTHINIDINPSLDLGINCFDKVISVSALNDDGKKLMETLDIKYVSYDDAIRRILENKSVEAMLSENELMTVTVIETNNAQSANILSAVKDCTNDYNNVHCHSASSAEASAAHELGLSYERYLAYLELRAVDPNITPEKIRNMTMREIRELSDQLTGNNCGSIEHDDHNNSSHHDSSNDTSSTSSEPGHHGNGHGHG
ncbi:MAG: hypothetical protein K2N56_00530 [Oscillospiraceae bacterium]|nr:hypothetical protein [Oscillospiraceae bacterium]